MSVKKQKKKRNRKYNPRKHAKTTTHATDNNPVNIIKRNAETINDLKPVMEAARRVQERQQERIKECE